MSERIEALRRRARALKGETYALYLACRDPRTPWYAKLLAGAIVAYALSPIDLIPDFVPLLGYADDLVIVPLGIILARKMIPAPVLLDCRARSEAFAERPTSRRAAAVIVAVWLLAAAASIWFLMNALN